MKNSIYFSRFTALLTVLCFVLTQNTAIVFAADAVTQGDNGAFVPVKTLETAQAEEELEAKPAPRPVDEFIVSPISAPTKPIDSIKPPVPVKPIDNIKPIEQPIVTPIIKPIDNIKPIKPIRPPVIKLPPAVQAFMNTLREQLGEGFDINAARQRDGTYLITVKDNKMYPAVMPDPKTGGLQEMSFSVNSKGVPVTDSKHPVNVTYYGFEKLNDALLVGAVRQLSAGIKASSAVVFAQQLRTLATLTVLSVDKDGAIHFKTTEDKYFKAYYGKDGKPAVVEEPAPVPVAVQSAVDQLVTAMEPKNFESTIKDLGNGMFAVTLTNLGTCPKGSVCVWSGISNGDLASMSFNISVKGMIDTDTLRVSYQGVDGVDAQLLFVAVKKLLSQQMVVTLQCILTPEDGCASPEASISDSLIAMSQAKVTEMNSDGSVYFAKDGVNYKAYRDGDKGVVVEEVFPLEVQKQIEELQRQLGPDYSVTAQPHYSPLMVSPPQRDGYAISVVFKPEALRLGQVRSFDMVVGDDGVMKGIERTVFDGVGSVDGQLLWEALSTMKRDVPAVLPGGEAGTFPGPIDDSAIAVYQNFAVSLTQVKVTAVDGDGAIYFTKDGVNYKTYRDSNKEVVVELVLQNLGNNSTINVEDGFYSVKAALDAAQPGATVTITGPGTLSGDKLVVKEGVTLIIEDGVILEIGDFQINGTLQANNLVMNDTVVLSGDSAQINISGTLTSNYSSGNIFSEGTTQIMWGGTFTGIISNPNSGLVLLGEQATGTVSGVGTVNLIGSTTLDPLPATGVVSVVASEQEGAAVTSSAQQSLAKLSNAASFSSTTTQTTTKKKKKK